jgi:hypothetical protein
MPAPPPHETLEKIRAMMKKGTARAFERPARTQVRITGNDIVKICALSR